MGRPKKCDNHIRFVERKDIEPFLRDIKGILKELHVALIMLEIELKANGYTELQIQRKIAAEFMRIKKEITTEEEEGML